MLAQNLQAQELQPRRWTHLPVGANFISAGAIYRDEGIEVDPTLELDDVTAEKYTSVVSYVRSFGLFGKSARVDVLLPYTSARWEGLLKGQPAAARRRGFNDPRVRFAVNLAGSPAQSGDEFRRFKPTTIVGAAVEIIVPAGQYNEDRLLNLSGNRWVVKPQVGIVQNRGSWATEVTASAWFYGDNDDFFGDRKLERDPVYAVQSHLIYTFKPGLWASLSGAYGVGGRVQIDGENSGERVGKVLLAGSVGLPITRKQGVKFTYLRGDTRKDTGSDDDVYLLAWSLMWGGD